MPRPIKKEAHSPRGGVFSSVVKENDGGELDELPDERRLSLIG